MFEGYSRWGSADTHCPSSSGALGVLSTKCLPEWNCWTFSSNPLGYRRLCQYVACLSACSSPCWRFRAVNVPSFRPYTESAFGEVFEILLLIPLTCREAVPLALALLNISNPSMGVMDTLSRLSHDSTQTVAMNAVLALGELELRSASCSLFVWHVQHHWLHLYDMSFASTSSLDFILIFWVPSCRSLLGCTLLRPNYKPKPLPPCSCCATWSSWHERKINTKRALSCCSQIWLHITDSNLKGRSEHRNGTQATSREHYLSGIAHYSALSSYLRP